MSEAAASEPSNRGVDKLSGYLCVRRGFGQHQQKLEGQEVAGHVMYTCPELAGVTVIDQYANYQTLSYYPRY